MLRKIIQRMFQEKQQPSFSLKRYWKVWPRGLKRIVTKGKEKQSWASMLVNSKESQKKCHLKLEKQSLRKLIRTMTRRPFKICRAKTWRTQCCWLRRKYQTSKESKSLGRLVAALVTTTRWKTIWFTSSSAAIWRKICSSLLVRSWRETAVC